MAAKKGAARARGGKLSAGTAASRKKGASGVTLLPPQVTLFLKNTGWRFVGAVLMVLALYSFVALLYFDPLDPTLNNLSERQVTNIMGPWGANIADILMQTTGLAAFALVLPLMVWALKIMRLHWLPRFWLPLAMLPVGVLLLSASFAVYPPADGFLVDGGYGGALGLRLYQEIAALVLPLAIPEELTFVVLLAAALGLLAFSLAMTKGEWRDIATVGWMALKRMGVALYAAIKAVLQGVYAQTKRVRKKGDIKRVEPEFSTPEVEDTEPARAPKAVVKPKAVTRKSARETREKQPVLPIIMEGSYQLPTLDLLKSPTPVSAMDKMSTEALEQNAALLLGVLEDFGVKGEIRDVRPGPVVTLYELEPARGTKSARVIGLADDIARSMSAVSARVAVVPGRNAIGIELPNSRRETVSLRELLASQDYEQSRARLGMVLGKDIGGAPVVADLASMPHLLVAGTTGSGKSVGVNAMILSLLYRHSPETLKLIMVDPKMLELSIYDGIPHLLTPVVTEPKKAVVALKWAVREMEERYARMSKLKVRNLAAYNKRVAEAKASGEPLKRVVQTGYDRETGEAIIEEEILDFEPLPYIVIVIDEMADLMIVAGKDVEATVQRLAQMARAAGLHVVMATQRPSVDVITGTIKANFPTRISFQVTSKIDSRTILNEQGAEQLLGAGDMLYMAGGGRITRVHGAFVDDKEVEEVVAHLKKQGKPDYVTAVTEEPEGGFDSPFIPGPSAGDDNGEKSLYDKAVDIVLRDRRASTSYIQRRLSIGYNRAATLIEEMEQQGVISAPNHKGQREILVPEREEDIL